MQIFKFGGTSVGTAASIRKVAEIIDSEIPKIVVLSANGKSTDILENIIRYIDEADLSKINLYTDQLSNYYNALIIDLFETEAIRTKAKQALEELMLGIRSCFKLKLSQADKNWLITRGELFSTIIFSFRLSKTFQ